MNPPLAQHPTDNYIDGLLLRAAASGRMPQGDLDALVAYVIALRAGGVSPGLISSPRTE